jgi:hypothetical protein
MEFLAQWSPRQEDTIFLSAKQVKISLPSAFYEFFVKKNPSIQGSSNGLQLRIKCRR